MSDFNRTLNADSYGPSAGDPHSPDGKIEQQLDPRVGPQALDYGEGLLHSTVDHQPSQAHLYQPDLDERDEPVDPNLAGGIPEPFCGVQAADVNWDSVAPVKSQFFGRAGAPANRMPKDAAPLT